MLQIFSQTVMSNATSTHSSPYSIESFTHGFDYLHLVLVLVAVVYGFMHLIHNRKAYIKLFETRNLRKVWGIKDGDYVNIVCSELDNPEERQTEEPREFIYTLKYGDIDAYFEVIVTLFYLYPNIKLRMLSAGEAESTRIDMSQHLILIGGPDYNFLTAKILEKQIAQYNYSSLGKETALYNKQNKKNYYEDTDQRDYGYLERIENPDNPKKHIILVGGCHTIGVTGAAKAFSIAGYEQEKISSVVLENAKKVAKKISNKQQFSVLVNVERTGQTISVPIVSIENVLIRNQEV